MPRRHYIITNRRILDEYTDKERIQVDGKDIATEHVRFGYIETNEDLKKYKKDSNNLIQLYPHQEWDDADITKISDKDTGSAKFFGDLYQAMCSPEGGDTLFFVHGYNADLKDAVQLIGILEERYIRPDSPIKQIVMFTWPARSSMLRYRNDIADAIDSGKALARAMLKLNTFYTHFFGKGKNAICGNQIHLMAHSAGNRVVESAMQALQNYTSEAIGQIFEETVLVAADVNNFALEIDQPMSYICDISKRVHTYNHKKDLALIVSQTTKNPHQRLGKNGVRDYLRIPKNTIMVDVTGVKEDLTHSLFKNAVSHWYHSTSSKVIFDIIQVFKGTHSRHIVAENGRQHWQDIQNLYYIS